MTAWALVTIGTDEVWAPPQPVLMDIRDDLVVVNAVRVEWEIHGKAELSRAAVHGREGWFRLLSFPRVSVRDAWHGFSPGCLELALKGEPISVEWEQQGRLGSGEPAEIAGNSPLRRCLSPGST